MNTIEPDISLSGGDWQIADTCYEVKRFSKARFSKAVSLHDRSVSTPPINNAFEESLRFEVESSLAETGITVTPVVIFNVARRQSNSLRVYQALIESLPLAKQAKLFEALSKINGYLTDIELSEDGQIIIETKEGGLECFYAICTKEGDFKGTWLSDGRLRTQSWPATPPFDTVAISLI